jgi:hypothetical protein
MDDTTRHFPLLHSQKQKNFRHLQTDTDQLALFLVRQDCAAKQLGIRGARGTGKNDHALRGNLR